MKSSRSRPDFVAPHLRDVPRSGIRDFFEIVSQREDVISLSIGEPDFVAPWHIREAAVFALDRGATSYTANLGLRELRQAVAAYVRRSFGPSYDPDTEILITVGVSEALDLAVRAVIAPGDEVLYHAPCYVSYAPVVAFAHGRPVAVPTRAEDGFRLRREALEAQVTPRTRALMLNFPTNPTGAVLAREDAEEIARFAVERDLLVITDEIYSELTYEAERVSVVAMPGMRERTIFLNGFSKTWAMTGFRVGFACAPPGLTEAMMKIHQYTMLCAPVVSQRAAIEALRGGDRDRDHMRAEYEKRRNFLHAGLNEIGLPCGLPGGAFYVFPSVAGRGLTSKEFSLRLLDEEKVACVPGSAFGSAGEGFIRCCFATDIEDIKEALARMGRFVRRLST
ncbi:MAG: aminotransferase class I/II-fold pyridoxal phosphate-dependent enzyme [Lentisphaerae bacterium]|nr:aminotransferase class I/II-fold pyridoxal phosphate-dependent enzyme [Lentisphaerota bacterium]